MRPNILLIMTDQQYGGAMSCAGRDELSTPAMDGLAARGVRFSQAYCTYPLCIPARESILAGRMPYELGYRKWEDAMDARFEEQQLGCLFRNAGYDCVYGGKLHAPGHDASRHGFRQICGMNDDRLADSCIDYLQGKHEKSFLMVASFDNPHNICQYSRHEHLPWGNLPEPAIEDCPNLPANFAIPSYEPQVIRVIQSRSPTAYPTLGNTPDDWRRYRNAYYRLIEKVDAEIGRILKALSENGLENNTLIAFTSDHGDGHGAHQWNQKGILYEECIRVPLILSLPEGMRCAKHESRQLISNGLDLLPTFCDYASVEAPADLPGRSLRPLLEGREETEWREELVIEGWPFQGDPAHTLGRVLRTSRYKYIVYSWGRHREQLHDMEADPGEMVNLAVNANYKDILNDHRKKLRRYCEETGDEFLRKIPVVE